MAADLFVHNVRPLGGNSADILIVAGRIARGPAPAGIPVLDGGGRIALPGLVEAHTHREWKNSGRSGRHLVAGSGSEPAIKTGGSDDSDTMSAPGRPSHSLTFAHASIGDLVDASFSARCRYRTIAVIPPMVADYASAVVSHVTAQLRALAQEIFGRRLLRIGAPEGDVLRVMSETHQLLIRLRRSAMPQQTPDTLDRRLGGL